MSGISPDQVSACLVTRGDVDLKPILETLGDYAEIVVWDNAKLKDLKVFGRYAAMRGASNEVCFVQDDDCIFRHHAELLAAYEPGLIVSTYGHGENPDGYEDLPLVCGGAVMDRDLPTKAFDRYLDHFSFDEGFLYEADFICGVLTPFKHVEFPFKIRDVAYNGKRLADEPWQRELKFKITQQARQVRDLVTA